MVAQFARRMLLGGERQTKLLFKGEVLADCLQEPGTSFYMTRAAAPMAVLRIGHRDTCPRLIRARCSVRQETRSSIYPRPRSSPPSKEREHVWTSLPS